MANPKDLKPEHGCVVPMCMNLLTYERRGHMEKKGDPMIQRVEHGI